MIILNNSILSDFDFINFKNRDQASKFEYGVYDFQKDSLTVDYLWHLM